MTSYPGTPIRDHRDRRWDTDLPAEFRPSTALFDSRVPTLAVVTILTGIATSIWMPDDGRQITPWSAALMLLAMAPWLYWLRVHDQGPHVQPVIAILAPVAALSIGYWFAPDFGATCLLSLGCFFFSPLLLVVMATGIAPTWFAVFTAVAVLVAFNAPTIAAVATGKAVSGYLILAWHLAFALSTAAGLAIRFSHDAAAAMSAAREAAHRERDADLRRQTAADVHDILAHTISVAQLHIGAARLALERDDRDAALHALRQAETQGRTGMDEIRSVVAVLRDPAQPSPATPHSVDDIGALIGEFRRAGLTIDADIDDSLSISAPIGATLYRVVQESLTNASKHGAGSASVRISHRDQAVHLIVENPTASMATGSGAGLSGMRARVSAVGGDLRAERDADRWIVHATFPDSIS